jgi:hypothetical protein
VTVTTADQFETRAAGWIHGVILLEEERRPMPPDPSPGMLLARVTERLTQAAVAIKEPGVEAENRELDELLEIAVYLLGAAAFAITAVSHLRPERGEMPPTAIKDAMLEQLDQDIAGTMESECDYLETGSPDSFVRLTLALLAGACQCVAELEDVPSLIADEEDEEDEEDAPTIDELLLEVEQSADEEEDDQDADRWEKYLFQEMIESLWHSATIAAVTGEQLIERHESARKPARAHRNAGVPRSR